VPVLFLKGVEDDWGMAIYGGLELIVVGYDYYKDSLPSQEAKDAWLAKMIAHEATHIIKPKEEPGLTPLEYEYFAQKASYEVAKNKAWKTDEDTVEGAKKVYEAFGILVSESKRQEVVDLFGIPVGDFIHLYYRGIVKPATEDKIYDPIVKITLFDTRNEEEKTVQVNIETGKIDLVVVPSAASPVVIKDKPASSAEENNYLKEVLRRQLIANNPATPAGENMATIDFEHTQRVVELANAVAKVLGADLEVVEKAALLHDIAKKPGLEALVKHHIEGARLAGEILKGRKSQEFIDKVQDAIMRHMGPLGKENDKGFMASIKDAYDKSSGENVNMPRPQSLEAIALKIADMLDLANGGVAKVVAKRQTEDVPDYFKADGQRETLRDSVKSALGSVEAAKKEIKDLTDTLVAMGVSKDVAVNIYNVSDLIGIRTKEFVDNLDWSKIPTHQEFSEAYNNNPLIPTTAEIVNFIQNGVAKSAGSPLEEQKEPVSSAVSNKGGIDLRALPIVTQPMGIQGLAPLSSGLVPLGRPQNALAGTDPKLDEEWREIQNMLNAGIIPSCERIKEYLQASCQSQDCSQRIDNMLACLADILRLEEERVCASELVLKEILVLLESDKPANEMQIALSRITVAPKEPKLIDTH
jgi:putative nucleotidyltransferase with HDIG domain